MLNDTFLPTCVHDCSRATKHDHCSQQWELLDVPGSSGFAFVGIELWG